jgi:hypothetical protein
MRNKIDTSTVKFRVAGINQRQVSRNDKTQKHTPPSDGDRLIWSVRLLAIDTETNSTEQIFVEVAGDAPHLVPWPTPSLRPPVLNSPSPRRLSHLARGWHETAMTVRKTRAGERIRTADHPLTRRALCLLSYTGGVVRAGVARNPCQGTGSRAVSGSRLLPLRRRVCEHLGIQTVSLDAREAFWLSPARALPMEEWRPEPGAVQPGKSGGHGAPSGGSAKGTRSAVSVPQDSHPRRRR